MRMSGTCVLAVVPDIRMESLEMSDRRPTSCGPRCRTSEFVGHFLKRLFLLRFVKIL